MYTLFKVLYKCVVLFIVTLIDLDVLMYIQKSDVLNVCYTHGLYTVKCYKHVACQ